MNNDNNTEPVLYAVGARGYSAYEVAVQNGFIGTEEEWLASLVGPQGVQGIQGKSAYQVAVDNGFIGTEEEWVHDFLTPDGYYTKTQVDGIVDGQLKNTDVVNTLDSNEIDKPLSAKQGKILNDKITTANTDIDNVEESISTEIANRENADELIRQQISGLGNGAPIPVASTSAMTDTTKLYLNTTDGYVYYYDGNDWSQGWLYQASILSNDSVITEKVNTPIIPKWNNMFYDKMMTTSTWTNPITKTNFTTAVVATPFSGNTVANSNDYVFVYLKVKVSNITATGVTVRGGIRYGSTNLGTSVNIPNQTVHSPDDEDKILTIYGIVNASTATKPINIQPAIFVNAGVSSSITVELKNCFVCGVSAATKDVMNAMVRRIDKYGCIDGLPTLDLTDDDLKKIGDDYLNKQYLPMDIIGTSALDVNFITKKNNVFDYIRRSTDTSWKDDKTFSVTGTLAGKYPFTNFPTTLNINYLFISCKITIKNAVQSSTDNFYFAVGARYSNGNHLAEPRKAKYITEDDIGSTFIVYGIVQLPNEETQGVTPILLVNGKGDCTYAVEDIFGCEVDTLTSAEMTRMANLITAYGYRDAIGEIVINDEQKKEINDNYLMPYVKEGIENKIYNITQDFNGLSFIFQTDFHMNNGLSGRQRSINSILAANYLCKKYPIYAYILGGDYIGNGANTTKQMAIDWMRTLQEYLEYYPNTFMLRGNHDCNPHTVTEQKLTDAEVYNCFGKYFDLNNIVTNPRVKTSMYGYIDYEKEKVRLVLVDTSDAYDMGVQYYGAGCINTTQLQWLADNAFDLSGKEDKENWKFIVMGHYPAVSFTDEDTQYESTGRLLGLWELLKAVRNGTNLNHINQESSHYFDVVKDFTSQGAIKLAYVCGHTHKDNNCKFSNVLQVSVDNISVDDKDGSELGTYDEIVFDIVTVDNTNDKLIFTRLGLGYDREFNL